MASLDANSSEKPVAAEEEQLVSIATKTTEPNPTTDEEEKTQKDEADASKGIQTTNDAIKGSHDGTHTTISENSDSEKIIDHQTNQKQGQSKIYFLMIWCKSYCLMLGHLG